MSAENNNNNWKTKWVLNPIKKTLLILLGLYSICSLLYIYFFHNVSINIEIWTIVIIGFPVLIIYFIKIQPVLDFLINKGEVYRILIPYGLVFACFIVSTQSLIINALGKKQEASSLYHVENGYKYYVIDNLSIPKNDYFVFSKEKEHYNRSSVSYYIHSYLIKPFKNNEGQDVCLVLEKEKKVEFKSEFKEKKIVNELALEEAFLNLDSDLISYFEVLGNLKTQQLIKDELNEFIDFSDKVLYLELKTNSLGYRFAGSLVSVLAFGLIIIIGLALILGNKKLTQKELLKLQNIVNKATLKHVLLRKDTKVTMITIGLLTLPMLGLMLVGSDLFKIEGYYLSEFSIYLNNISKIYPIFTYLFIQNNLISLAIFIIFFYILGHKIEQKTGSTNFALIIFATLLINTLCQVVFANNEYHYGAFGLMYLTIGYWIGVSLKNVNWYNVYGDELLWSLGAFIAYLFYSLFSQNYFDFIGMAVGLLVGLIVASKNIGVKPEETN